MGLFDAINIAGSGVTVHRQWLDAISDNVANINTVRPMSGPAFQERFVVAQSVDGGGVEVQGATFGNATGRVVYDPNSPLADKDGNVRMPDIDLGEQMSQMIMAQRGYQANLATVDRAKDAYQAAIQLGRGA
ncbi:MAG: flagellar basal body rod protein FlgC [Actinomycetales bacterium]